MSELPKRKWTRLKEHDYSSEGYYFLTICTKNKQCCLSTIRVDSFDEAHVELSAIGEIVDGLIRSIPGIDKYIVMPNHIRMIIHKSNGKPIANDVRSLKGLSTKRIGRSIWQDYYYDHIIRDEQDYLTRWQYIDGNPGKWSEDEYNMQKMPMR